MCFKRSRWAMFAGRQGRHGVARAMAPNALFTPACQTWRYWLFGMDGAVLERRIEQCIDDRKCVTRSPRYDGVLECTSRQVVSMDHDV